MISIDSPIVIIVDDDTRLRAAIQRLKTVGSQGASFTAQQDFCHTN